MTDISNKIFHTLSVFFGVFEYGVHKNNDVAGGSWVLSASKYLHGVDIEQPADFVDYVQIRKANAKGLNILIRPLLDVEPCFLLLDDMKLSDVQKHAEKPGRLIIQTSPDNFQIWIKSNRPLSLDEKKYWIKFFNADMGASPKRRWGRAPDFRNYKPQRAEHPWGRIIFCTNGSASIPFVKIPTPSPEIVKNNMVDKTTKSISLNISRNQYDKGDESATDYSYTLALLVRGATDEQIKSRLLAERSDFHRSERNIEKYLTRTIKKAREYSGIM